MGRLSIYLPDELEARAKALQSDTPTSQVIRAALERYLGRTGEPAYAQVPEGVDDLLAAGVAHFADLAKRDYQDGYRAALKRLPDLDWYGLAGFARHDFDIYRWADSWKSSMSQFAARGFGELEQHAPDWLWRVAEDLGELLSPLDFDHLSFRRTPPYERGYADGLRAGYEAALGAGALDVGGSITGSSVAEDAAGHDATGASQDQTKATPGIDNPGREG